MSKFSVNGYAAQLNAQVQNNVTSALYLSAFTLKVQLETGLALTTAGAWSALGNAGKPTKKDKTAYTRANNLQRRAAKTADVLSKLSINPAQRPTSFEALCQWVNSVDFGQAFDDVAIDAVNALAKPFNVLVSDGASFYEYMLHAVGAAQAGSLETTDGKGEDGEGEGEGGEGDNVDTSDKVAELQRLKAAAKATIEGAAAIDVIAAAVEACAGIDDVQLAMATLINAWTADRATMLRKMDGLESELEKATTLAAQLKQTNESLQTTKALKTALKTA